MHAYITYIPYNMYALHIDYIICVHYHNAVYTMHAHITYILYNMYTLLHIYYKLCMHVLIYAICYACMYYIHTK